MIKTVVVRGRADGGFVELGAFMKLSGAVSTGGQTKSMVQSGLVRVNGVVCAQRGRKLHDGDVVESSAGAAYRVVIEEESD